MGKPLRRTGTGDPKTLALEDAAAQTSRDTEVRLHQAIPDHIKQGKMISGLTTASNVELSVPHGLGKKPNGASMMHCEAANPVGFCVVSMDESKVVIKTHPGAKLDLWVY
jgi:hypothetical protein